MRTGANRPTIRDVAEQAGVSLGTASNVLNRPHRVALATRERVLDAIEEIGFVRSTAAYQLRAGKSRSVGVVILDVSNPFFTEMARGIEDVCSESDLVIVLCSTDELPEREARYLRLLDEQRVQGVLITPAGRKLDGVERLRRQGMPVVLLDSRSRQRDICAVFVDDVKGGELAGAHLLEAGHRRIGFLNGPLSIRQCADRRRGLRQAVKRAGLDPDRCISEYSLGALTASQGEAIVPRLLADPSRPTGVFCANDVVALGFLTGLRRLDGSTPGPMAVVGYDDVSFAAMLSPSLTSVRQPIYDLGRTAGRLLLDEMTNPDHQHQQVLFEPELVVRDSSLLVGRQERGGRRGRRARGPT
jgi:LacI family transcriptional regulator